MSVGPSEGAYPVLLDGSQFVVYMKKIRLEVTFLSVMQKVCVSLSSLNDHPYAKAVSSDSGFVFFFFIFYFGKLLRLLSFWSAILCRKG